ncbi:hypothetical protein AOLI_G00098620 [Acnodon oligacanthus]
MQVQMFYDVFEVANPLGSKRAAEQEEVANVYVGVTVPVCGKERVFPPTALERGFSAKFNRKREIPCFGCWQDPKGSSQGLAIVNRLKYLQSISIEN